MLFPAVALFVDSSHIPDLHKELELRNQGFSGKIHSIRSIYQKPEFSKCHIKIFFNCRQTRDMAILSGEVDFFNTFSRLVEVNIDREVRRCYNCQGYGHTQANCRSPNPNCGKCAGNHITRNCSNEERAPLKCANCAGNHEAGDKSCQSQIKAVARYRALLKRQGK